ncbi:hypothetical protein H4R18_001293 [Coemansia javaensis]|uniref:DNA-directed RNA polymerase III subunit RPC9 n=1 Tax=Coemansia javaensis TaxID=2761396 RepID=A0A9W8HFI2_9FUNG|nr:hypothetical protein H4R18_001293 [Coemansia javaensis]
MEVLDRQEALLTNYEVLLVLDEESARHRQAQEAKGPENVTTLVFEALEYLKGTACPSQSGKQIAALKSQLAGMELTKAELLQIVNLRPKSLVELHLITEECSDRFSGDALEQMLGLIQRALPRDDDDSGGGDEGAARRTGSMY